MEKIIQKIVKPLSTILAAVMFLSLFTVIQSSAYISEYDPLVTDVVTIDDVRYEYRVLDDGTIEIRDIGSVNNRNLNIPNIIDKKTVTSVINCSVSFKSIQIPDTVKNVGSSFFASSRATLESVKLPVNESFMFIPSELFYECRSLKSVEIPSNIISIGDCAFYGCLSLQKVIFSEGLKYIGDCAFENCTALESIDFSNTIKEIDDAAFRNCTNLKNVCLNNGLKRIRYEAFKGCSSLESIMIPSSVEGIDYSVFFGCTMLTDIDVESNNINYSSQDGILFNKDGTELIKLPSGKSDNLYVIPEKVSKIHWGAFAYCSSLKQIVLNNNINIIGSYTFYNCTSLESITIPNSVSDIESRAFEGCISLKNITIPYSVNCIGDLAFNRCPSLTQVTILNSTTSIKTWAFGYNKTDDKITKIDNCIIYGEAGSTAYNYAKSNGFNFVAIDLGKPTSILIEKQPTKTVYTVGETFNTSGLSIKVNMSDGASKTVTSGFTVSAPDMTTAGTKTVTVTYEGKTATFNITVNKPVSPTSAKYKISGATATAGSTVEVYVSIENNPGIISLRNQVIYDTSVLELVKVEDLKLLSGYTTPSPTVDSPYTLRWADSLATQNNIANGNVVKLTFKIKDDAQEGDYGISVSHIESRKTNGEKVEFADCSSVITVIDYIPGDVDGNGEVDDWDAIVLNRYLAGWQTQANLAAADMDGDGELTDWDAIALERRLAGWDV